MDYQTLLANLKKKRDYFNNIEFLQLAGDFNTIISALEALLTELDEKNNIINSYINTQKEQ